MSATASLRRELGVVTASALGLGSILGSGVFVGLGLVAGVAGSGVLIAVALAGLLAVANGLSSAQLAAVHPVSGGTYEYGYRWLAPWVGFVAGVAFLLAKSASAAVACLAVAGHVLDVAGVDLPLQLPALALLASMTWVASRGVRLGAVLNLVLVAFTVATLLVVSLTALASRGLGAAFDAGAWDLATPANLLEGTALAFVAFTGYGRIATMGEEVREPKRTIPRAVALALVATLAIYAAVASAALATLGPVRFHAATVTTGAPLELVAREAGPAWLPFLVAVAAVLAMCAVLLNLVLGLSRVALAMARRGDLPAGLAHVDACSGAPRRATVTVAIIVGVLVGSGDLSVAWSFSAFTVLLYYAITNLSALRLRPEERFAPRIVPLLGLVGCATVGVFVDVRFLLAGLAAVLAALAVRGVLRGRGVS